MRRREIQKKFDEIVAFAEVERFIDTPVKRYSSGMYVRLAFAVAAHLEPEIFVVDEVLAVGDVEFQKKCLGKMDEVSRCEGRTVLFVSHNLAAVGEMTHRALLLESVRIADGGPTPRVISTYLSQRRSTAVYSRAPDRLIHTPHITRAEIVTSDPNGVHRFSRALSLKFWIKHEVPLEKACLSVQIINQFQQPTIYAWAFYPDVTFGNKEGETLLICKFPSLRLNIGQYHLRVHLTEPPEGAIYENLTVFVRSK